MRDTEWNKNAMIAASKQYEQIWRHLTEVNPKQLAKFVIFLRNNKSLFETVLINSGMSKELWGRITMGIYHHPQIQEPPELEYKIHLN